MKKLYVFISCTLWAMLLVMLLAPNQGWTQATTGQLEGWLIDAQQKPVEGVNITISSVNLQGQRGAMSNADGYFVLPNLPIGLYNLRTSHVAFREKIFQEVPVRLGKTTSLGRGRN